ncbi:MAG: TRAP transporter small permease [Boseongicola sp.]|nr:TRAP transporter small permease [Boseongicola sp.]MYH59939.1 TRAP transporter small permease [Boseongicola sp. SB0675_bin_26]
MHANWTDAIEETLIAALLGLMTLLTFANVIARYVFNSNILWALELTVFAFGWLVLLGASYAVKKGMHLGVDLVINAVQPRARRALGLVSVACCIAFAFLLLKGGYDYWAVFADLPPTEGRWFPLGFPETFRSQSFYEVNDIPLPGFLRFIEGWLLYPGDPPFEKVPKAIPYIVLPLSAVLLLLRFLQAAWRIWKGTTDRLVVSHEVDDELAETRAGEREMD